LGVELIPTVQNDARAEHIFKKNIVQQYFHLHPNEIFKKVNNVGQIFLFKIPTKGIGFHVMRMNGDISESNGASFVVLFARKSSPFGFIRCRSGGCG
jgi:hypothetical protein